MEGVKIGAQVVYKGDDEYGVVKSVLDDGKVVVRWDRGDLTSEIIGENVVELTGFYDQVQAEIRENHEKLISGELTPDNSVEHPKHYNSHPSGVECITVAQHHTFCIGNVLRYLWRAGLKGEATELEDLRKARQYLDFEIERIEQSEG